MKNSKIVVIGLIALMAISGIFSFAPSGQNGFMVRAASSLDGHNKTTATSTSNNVFTLTLSTSNPNDLLYISVYSYNRYVAGITSSLNGLTWTCRQPSGQTISSSSYYFSTWYAIQPSSGSTTISVRMSGSLSSSNAAEAVVFGISGVDTSASPFDSAYSTTSGNSNHPSYSKITSNANDFIIGALGVRGGSILSSISITPGLTSVGETATFTSGLSNYFSSTDEYQVVSTAYPSGFSVGYTLNHNFNWVMVVDAVKAPTVPVTFQTSGLSSDASGTVLTIDGTQYSYSQLTPSITLNLVPGSTHTVAATSTISAGTGKHYSWSSWTNPNGLSGASGTLTVPSSAQIVTANYATQYQVSFAVNPQSVGTTNPSASTWYNAGSNSIPLTANANSGYQFSSWGTSGSITLSSTSSSTTTITAVNSAGTITANFVPMFGASISPSSWAMDIGQSKDFHATAVGGSGSYTSYHWYVNSVLQTGQTSSTFSFSSGSVGSYSVTVTVTDSLGATSPQSSPSLVTVSAFPTVDIAPVGPLVMDVGQVQVFTAVPVGGAGTLSYHWYLDSNSVGSNSASYSYTASGASASITCTVTDSASPPVTSILSSAVSVTINSALISPSTSASLGMITQTQSSTLSFTGLSGGTTPYSYQWLAKAPGAESFSAIGGATANTYTFTPSLSNAPGIWSFKLQVTDSASSGATVTSSAASVILNSGSTVWDFEDHTYTHDDLTLQTPSEIVTQETTQNALFTQYGLPAPIVLAYPSGYYDDTVISVISQYRQAGRLANSGDVPALYPISNYYELSSQELASDTVYQHVVDSIDAAIAQKGLLNLYTHAVSDNLNVLQVYPGCTPQLLGQVLDYLKLKQDAGLLQVLTVRQAVGSFDGQIAVVTISFDDALMTDYTVAYPMFQAHGFAGTSFIPGHLVGDQSGSISRLTWAQIEEMAQTNPPAWTLTINSDPSTGGGSTSLSGTINVQQYSISVTATSAVGYVFGGWVFDGTTFTTNTITLGPQTSGSVHSLTAYFVPNAASTVYQDGFESGSFSPDWFTSGSTTIVSSPSPVHSGTYAARASGYSYWDYNTGSSSSDLFFAGYVQFPQLPAADESVNFLYIYDSTYSHSVRGGIYEASSGTSNQWLLSVGGTWFLSSSHANLQTNHWYFVEIEYKTSGVARMWVDNVLVSTAYGQAALSGNARIVQGGNPHGGTPTGYISYGDDYQIATGYIASVLPAQDPVIFSSGFDSPIDLSDWSGLASDNPLSSGSVIGTDSYFGGYCFDSKLNEGATLCDVYKNFPTSSSLYLGMWVKSINFASTSPPAGWNNAVGVGGFEPTTSPHSHTEIVAVNDGTGVYWGMIYSQEPLGTLMYIRTDIPVVDGQWIHFVLYENVGTGQNDASAILYVQTGSTWTVAASAIGFDAVPDYAPTGVWIGQYVANGMVPLANTEFHMDSIQVSTSFSTFDLFTIEASATPGGSISPSGSISLNRGDSQTFTVTVNPGYHLVSVLMDGQPANAPYTFNNVIANGHTIVATFAIDTFAVTVTSDHGNPTASASVDWGTDFPVSVTSPDVIVVDGHQYVCTGFSVDGGVLQAGTSYTFYKCASGSHNKFQLD